MHIDITKPYCIFMRIYDDGYIFYGWGRISSAFEIKNMGHGNYIVYVEEMFSTPEEARRARDARSGGTGSKKAVRCVETGTVFPSQAAAAHATFTDAGRMSQHLRGVKGFKTIRGFTFEKVENYTGEFNQDLVEIHSIQAQQRMV